MWATLTLLGKSFLGVGSVRSDKPDMDKELIGDFLRNASMRFGIALSLWSKQDWSDNTTITTLPTAQRAEEAKKYVPNHPAKGVPSPKVVQEFVDDRVVSLDEVAEIFNATTVVAEVRPITSGGLISDKQKGLVSKLGKEKLDGDVLPVIKELFNKTGLAQLTTKEGSALIKHLMEM